MKQQDPPQPSEGIDVGVSVEAVPYRSAAWRELWRQLFLAIEEELDRLDGELDEAGSPEDPQTGGILC